MAGSAIYPSGFTPTFSPVEFHLSFCTFRADEDIKISKYFLGLYFFLPTELESLPVLHDFAWTRCKSYRYSFVGQLVCEP